MENPLHYQAAIHRAKTVDEVGDILKSFFAAMTAREASVLPAGILAISTFSERGLLRKSRLARETAASSPAGSAAEKLLATASLKVCALQMDEERANRRGKLWSWLRPR